MQLCSSLNNQQHRTFWVVSRLAAQTNSRATISPLIVHHSISASRIVFPKNIIFASLVRKIFVGNTLVLHQVSTEAMTSWTQDTERSTSLSVELLHSWLPPTQAYLESHWEWNCCVCERSYFLVRIPVWVSALPCSFPSETIVSTCHKLARDLTAVEVGPLTSSDNSLHQSAPPRIFLLLHCYLTLVQT